MKTKNKLTKKLLSVLAVAMVCTTSLVPAFAYAEDTAGDTAKSNQPTAATKEVTETSNDIDAKTEIKEDKVEPNSISSKAASVEISSNINGHSIVQQDGKDIQIVSSGKTETINCNIGDELEVMAFGTDAEIKLVGAKEIKKKALSEGNVSYVVKIEDSKANISLSFARESSTNMVMSQGFSLLALTSSKITQTGNLENSGVGKFWASASGGNLYGVCCQRSNHSVPAVGDGVSLSKISNTSPVGRVAYYGATHPNEASQYITSATATYIRNGYSGSYDHWGEYQDLAAKAKAGTLAAGPAGFEAYIGTVGSKQHVLLWRTVPVNGKLKLKKSVASDAALVAECPNTYSLAGAKYTVKNASGTVVGTLTTRADGSTNVLSLPPGTYTVKESVAPKGYALDQKTYTATIAESATVTLKSSEVPLFDPISIVLNKTADGESYLNPGNMEGAEFEIKYYDTVNDDLSGSSMTRTWKLKTELSANGKYGATLREKFLLDGSDALFIDETGSAVIPRGIITIKETKAPKGYKVDTTVYKYKIEKDPDGTVQNMVFNFGATPDQPNKPLVPSIKTTAADAATEDGAGRVDKDITIKDTVSYKELSEGETYTIKGTLMDKETGEPLLVDGKEITAEKTFTVTKENSTIDGNGAAGTVDLEFTLNSSALAGKTTVVFEKLFYDDKEIAVHEDIEDEGQSVHFPDIKTTATAEESKDHQGTPSENETLTDVVKYTNLIPGKEYTIKGTLMDKESNSAILDKDGKEVTAEKTFTPDTADGEVSITFTYDSSLRQGHSTVVFEDLYHNDVKLTSHADIEDKDQTIDYPDIKTTAAVATTSTDTHGKFEMVRIVDVVKYTNLIPGKEYVVKGKLMDKTTGEPLIINDKEVTAETKFTAKTVNGKAYLNYEFDAKEIAGKTVVVFEDLYYNDFKIATHSDIEDNDQTVRYPTLRTKAAITNEGSIESTGKAHITDVVYYTNLVPGKTYTVKGTLMDKKDNKPFVAGGKVVTATKTFTPENPSGEVNIDFVFDAKDIQGETVVAFENMYQNNVLVGTHSDINDKAQTVTFGSNPKTGDNAKIPMACAALLGAALVAILIAKKKRK